MKTSIENVHIFGNHHEYDGDQPWWTLRFKSPLTAKDKKRIGAVLDRSGVAMDGNFEPLVWESDRQCHWDSCDPYFGSPKAGQRFYDSVDKLFLTVHNADPLFAIFFQVGQFHESGQELVHLDDDELERLD